MIHLSLWELVGSILLSPSPYERMGQLVPRAGDEDGG